MTDDRQNLDSDLSSTATAEPPAEERPEGGESDAALSAAPEPDGEKAEAAATASGEGGAVRAETSVDEGEQGTVEAATAGGEEGEPLAAVGEVAGAAEAQAAAEVAEAPAGDEPPAAEAGAQASAPDGGDENGADAPQSAEAEPRAADATAETAPAGEEEIAPAAVQAAETAAQPAAAAEPESAHATDEAAAEPATEAAASDAAEPQAAAAIDERPEAEPEVAEPETAVTVTEPEAAAPQAAAAAPAGEAAAEPPQPPPSQPEAGASPATAGETSATPAEPATPQAEASASPAAAAEATAPPAEAAAAQPAAAAAEAAEPTAPEAAAAEPEEPEEPEDPALAALREAREKGTPVEGRVIGWNRGGFHVVVGEVTAFCPSSEMEVGRPKSPQSYVEKTFQFKVIKYQKKGRRVVLSRAAVLGEKRQQVLAELTPGKVVQGRVTSLPDFGAFVDLGGLEGLVHVSEISRSRVQHPKDALQLGQEVEVKVLKVEQGGERISLSMKDLEPDPWKEAGQRFGRGDRFSGKVLRKTEFGLFVEIQPDVEGLLHVSQLPPGKSMDDAALQPGQAIEGWVREVEPKRQRISLSLREVPSDDPWKEVAKRFPEGESVEGTVESIAPFGVFITLAPGVTGLLPNSQTGLPRGTNAARAFSPGQSVRVQVLSVDSRRKRISLGREGTRVEASKNDLQDFKRRERERERETPTAMAAAFARLRGDDSEQDER